MNQSARKLAAATTAALLLVALTVTVRAQRAQPIKQGSAPGIAPTNTPIQLIFINGV